MLRRWLYDDENVSTLTFSEVMWPNVTSVTLFFRPIRWWDRQINVDQPVTFLAFSLQLMKPRFFESQIIWARGISWQIANGEFCTFTTAVNPTGFTYLQRHLVTRAIFKNFDSPIFLNLTAKRRNKVQSSQSKTFARPDWPGPLFWHIRQ